MADTRRDKRAPVSLKVRFKSATIDEFVEQYSADISRGGLFIKSKKPMKIGTLLKFELQLKDESRLIHGVGRVVWRRDPGEAGDKAPAGMGIKFIKMGADSRTLVQQIVDDRGDQPGTFDEGAEGPKKEASFFPDEGPAKLPAPEDRTQVRHASEFLAEALSEADEGAAAEAQESADQARKRTEEIQKERAEAEERRKAEEAAAAARAREQEEAAAKAEAEAEAKAEAGAEEPEEEEAPAATVPDAATEEAALGAAETVPADESPAKEAPSRDISTDRPPAAPEEESKGPWLLVGLVTLIAAAVGVYFWWSGQQQPVEEIVEEIEVEEEVLEEPFVEEEEPGTVDVHVESNVPAEIFADGVSLGTTPLDAPLELGTAVTLEARAAGYGSAEQTLTPSEELGGPVTFELALIPWVIVVETEPTGARISANGRYTTSPGRIELEEAPTATLTIAATKPGFRIATTEVALEAFTEQDGAMVASVQLQLGARASRMVTMTAPTMMATPEETTMEAAMEATMAAEPTMEAAMEAAPTPMETAMEEPPSNPF